MDGLLYVRESVCLGSDENESKKLAHSPSHSKYDGQRIFQLLQTVSNALSDATFTPLPTRINPAFR